MKFSTLKAQQDELRRIVAQVESVTDALDKGEKLVQLAEREITERERQAIAEFQALNPADKIAVGILAVQGAELKILRDYCANCKPLLDGINQGVGLLNSPQLRYAIENCSEVRNPVEYQISCRFWKSHIANIEMVPPLQRLYNLRKALQGVSQDLTSLLAEFRPAHLSIEEVREGRVELGKNLGYRAMTPEERVTRKAFL